MRKPSVLFLNRVYPPVRGATGRVLRDLAQSLSRQGWQVTVITTGPRRGRELDGTVKVIRLRGSEKPSNVLVYMWIWIKMLVAALRLPGSNLVVTMSDPPLLIFAGQIIRKFKGGRHINWCHDLYPDIFPAINVRLPGFLLDFFKIMSRRAMKNTDKVIVVGRCMARKLAFDGIDPKHITMIPNWPDFELLQPVQEANNNAQVYEAARPHDELLKDGPKFRVLYAGNIGLAHPIDTILEAAEMLYTDHPEIEFMFVGDGPRFDKIAQERSRRGLDNIRLVPYQPASRLRQLMESGDVHLISVKDEAEGMLVPCKLYSALAVQRPCVFVGPEKSEVAEVITDFKAGTIVPQGRADLLAARIKHYRLNSEEWFAAQNGAASAGEVFVPGDAIEAWIERAWGVVEADIRV